MIADTSLQGMQRHMPIQFGPQQDHMRRNSSQSIHSDAGGPGVPPAGPNNPRGNFAGRGRGSYNHGYHQQQPAPYSPQPQFRPAPNGRQFQPGYQGRGQPIPYQGSPAMGTRSPALVNAQPGTPNMGGQIHMVQPGMPQQPNGYFMGPQHVNAPAFPSTRDSAKEPAKEKGKPTRGRGRGGSARGVGRGRGSGRGGHEERSTFFSRDPASDNHPANFAASHSHTVQVTPELAQGPIHVFAKAPFPFPDLSPESGNFERFQEQVLTVRPQGYPMTQADPSIQQMYMQQMQMYNPQSMQGQFNPPYNMQQPQSPRPPFNQGMYAPNMQPSYSNQGGPPPSMSRQSSQISAPDRPGSSIGQQPSTPAPTAPPHTANRAPSVSSQKNSFSVPPKKSAAIIIKNASGEVVNFNKPPASPATSTPASAIAPPQPAPTPPSRTTSAAGNAHGRAESISMKSAEDVKKAMQEAVAKKIAEDEARQKKDKDTADKVEADKVAAEQAEREAAEAHEKEEAEKESQAAAEKEAKETAEKEAKATAEKAAAAEQAEKAEKAEAAKQAEVTKQAEAAKEAEKKLEESKPDEPSAPKAGKEEEIDFDALAAEMEAEDAAREAEENRLEEEYNKKKAAKQELADKKAKEEAAAYEENMKELERKAEEEEIAREKEKAEGVSGDGDDEGKKLFAELKPNPFGTPSGESPAGMTPAESGTATPVSDVSMPPPAKATRRPKAAELTLDTKKPVEPPEPSATLKALQSAKKVDDISKIVYPSDIASPNPALNSNAPADRGFKYNKEFLLQFKSVFKEKPTLDWDARIREALGDGDPSARPSASARTPSSMGGRSASSRGPAAMNFGGPMGNFGGNNRSALPPGTTSEQRFAASNAAMRTGPMASNPFAQFGRPGGQMPPAMGRTPSNNPLGPIPGSPRGGGPSRGGSRVESKRGGRTNTRHNAEDNKSMPLTAGMNVGTLETTSTGWKPRSVGQSMVSGPALGGEGLMDPEMVQRKTKSLLNKMTPEKFDKIADQILEISGQSKHESDGRTLRQVIQLTFEKATDESHWAGMYAQFCRRMLESMSADIRDEGIKDKNGSVVTGGNLFRKYLLNRCQEEFERGWKVNIPEQPESKSGEAVMLSDEYYIAQAAKRRGLGLVKFIGELFKLSMLTERIMHECVKKLVDYEGTPDEAEIESLTSLLQTVGRQLDDPESKAQGRMDLYFERIKQMVVIPDLPSRLRFMLMDVIDLRSKGWASKADNKGPQTITEIREQAERQAHEAELKRIATQSNRGGGGGRMPMGRGDARNFSYGQVPPPDTSNRVGTDDLRRLGNRNTRNTSNTAGPVLGPSSMMGARTNSGRRGLGPAGLLGRGDDSANSSRTGTPPAQKEKKDEASTNAFR